MSNKSPLTCCGQIAGETLVQVGDFHKNFYHCVVCHKFYEIEPYLMAGEIIEYIPPDRSEAIESGGILSPEDLVKCLLVAITVNGGVFSVPKKILARLGDDWMDKLSIDDQGDKWVFKVKVPKRKRGIIKPGRKKILTPSMN